MPPKTSAKAAAMPPKTSAKAAAWEWCDPRLPCHGPFDVCRLDTGVREAFFTPPSKPPAAPFNYWVEPGPGELAKHAVSEGTKAVTKYTSSK